VALEFQPLAPDAARQHALVEAITLHIGSKSPEVSGKMHGAGSDFSLGAAHRSKRLISFMFHNLPGQAARAAVHEARQK
jgi:hypothetical protein